MQVMLILQLSLVCLRACRKLVEGSNKAQHSLSIIVHLNQGLGTHLPSSPPTSNSAECCDMSCYQAVQMERGDASVFYQDVPHCGPAHSDSSDERDVRQWRWVLFAMFSPAGGADQDNEQQNLRCD